MKLWIRSQDREALIKVNMGIMYWKGTDDRDCIVNKDNATGYSILAAYKTKERALEVLDEIQDNMVGIKAMELSFERIPTDELVNNENIKKLLQIIIYQMPKE